MCDWFSQIYVLWYLIYYTSSVLEGSLVHKVCTRVLTPYHIRAIGIAGFLPSPVIYIPEIKITFGEMQ